MQQCCICVYICNIIASKIINMKKFNVLFACLLAVSVIGLSSCSKDEENNSITIRMISPTSGQKVADPKNVLVKVEVEASDENHEVEVYLYAHGASDSKIIDKHIHDHDKVVKFEQAVDLSSFPAGTDFHLKVEACSDHDCEAKVEKEIEFSI